MLSQSISSAPPSFHLTSPRHCLQFKGKHFIFTVHFCPLLQSDSLVLEDTEGSIERSSLSELIRMLINLLKGQFVLPERNLVIFFFAALLSAAKRTCIPSDKKKKKTLSTCQRPPTAADVRQSASVTIRSQSIVHPLHTRAHTFGRIQRARTPSHILSRIPAHIREEKHADTAVSQSNYSRLKPN